MITLDTGKPLVSQPVNILGKNQIIHIPERKVWDQNTKQWITNPTHVETTPYYLNSTNDGIITVT
ncbi:MAG: hypothetical protein LBT66_04060 [Methanobrevibacter sp.]|jgi:hypothetical protein|nr:hypothetical protein [Candidatus Methanovirga meridionalis]